jgi:hypothetical protein
MATATATRTTTEIYSELTQLIEQFQEGHNAGTKVGAKNARLALGSVKKLVTEYRKASSAEAKQAKKK